MTQTIRSAWSNVASAATPGAGPAPESRLVAGGVTEVSGAGPFAPSDYLAVVAGGGCWPLGVQHGPPGDAENSIFRPLKKVGYASWRVRKYLFTSTSSPYPGTTTLDPAAYTASTFAAGAIDSFGGFTGLSAAAHVDRAQQGSGSLLAYASWYYLEVSPDGVTWPAPPTVFPGIVSDPPPAAAWRDAAGTPAADPC
jgi:hypothetical protein